MAKKTDGTKKDTPLKKVAKKPTRSKKNEKILDKTVDLCNADQKVHLGDVKVDLLKNPNEYIPEVNLTGAPKNFMIRCNKCKWARLSSGLKDDIADLQEINSNCVSCGNLRLFRCKKCNSPSKMKRIKGNT